MKKKLAPVKPGEILLRQFLTPLSISQNRLARELNVAPARVSHIVKGKTRITPDMALRLGRYFKTGPELWLNLQNRHDLKVAELEFGDELKRKIEPISDEELAIAA